jgi:hypothetical protein
MTFEKRLEAFNDLCNERAKILVENKELIAQYEKYQKSLEGIKEKYSDIINSVSPEYLEKLVNEKINDLEKKVEVINWKYVSTYHKESIWNKLIKGKKEITYKEINEFLRARTVKKECGLFFRNQVTRYKRVGGNKNRKLILTS